MTRPMPEVPDNPDYEWPEATKVWWSHLETTPGADQWSDSDWDQLGAIALIHGQIWREGNFDLIPQLQKLLASFGITPAARSQGKPAAQQAAQTQDVDTEFIELMKSL